MDTRPPQLRVRWDEFINKSGEEIPACAVMRVVQIEDEETLWAYKPDGSETQILAFNGPFEVPSESGEGRGICTRDFPAEVLFDETGDDPISGAIFGPGTDWKLHSANNGFRVLGKFTAYTVKVITPDFAPCIVPVGIRIDGGDAETGYEWTAMQPTEADLNVYEEVPGYDSTTLLFLASEPNGLTITPGVTIYPGQINFCKPHAFFFGDDDPGEFYIEFLETEPSVGNLHSARIIEVSVDEDGLDVYTPGAMVLCRPLNNTVPTLEIIYTARRSEDWGTVNGLVTCTAYRCCDEVEDQSSSGGGGGGEDITQCLDWNTIECTYTLGLETSYHTLVPVLGAWASPVVEHYDGWFMYLNAQCDGNSINIAVVTDSGTGPPGFPFSWRTDPRYGTEPMTWSGIGDWDYYGDIPGESGGELTVTGVT